MLSMAGLTLLLLEGSLTR